MDYLRRAKILLNLCWRLLILRLSNPSNREEQSRKLLFESFKYLGGVYIKFLQLLALSVDFMSGWAGPTEFNVFETVTTEPIDVRTLVNHELSNVISQFSHIETEPFAAGSFAQVYHATLTDGEQVVLKILRPSLIRYLKFDLRLLGFVARVAQWLFPMGVADLNQAYKQFAAVTLAETDYAREVANAKWFYAYFENKPKMHIPFTYQDLSSAHIITQEYIAGISLTEVFKQQKEGLDPYVVVADIVGSNIWTQLETLGSEFLIAAIQADFVFGDPHPGNIRLLPDNVVGLVDFGIVASAPRDKTSWVNFMREYLKLYEEMFDPGSFVLAALDFFDKELAEALTVVGRELGLDNNSVLLDKISQAATEILHSEWDNPVTQTYLRRKMMTRLFNSTVNQGNRFGVKFDLESLTLLKASHTYLSMLGNLGQNGENFVVIRKALENMIYVADSGIAIKEEPGRKKLATDYAIELVSDWLSQVADRDPFLYQQLTATMGSHA